MTARDTYNASVKSAAMTKAAADTQAEMIKQEAINANRCNVGYTLQSGNYANLASSVKSAESAKVASLQSNEHAKQTTINAAKDTLRSTGDLGPA